MKTVGIIAEYNPFHRGHQHQIQQIRKETGADYVIAAISGDFVQRGEPAVFDKYTRTHMALQGGADLVLELPCAFATSSAEDFASCGIALFDRLGVVDLLCFGSECGAVDSLSSVATLLLEEPKPYLDALKEQLKEGISFPRARQEAVARICSGHASHEPAMAHEILSFPNNILGIEYIKAILRRNSPITPYTIKREGHGYHDCTIGDEGYASASAIRTALAGGQLQLGNGQMPVLPPEQAVPVFPDDLSALCNYRLLTLFHQNADLTRFLDVSTELADRIFNQVLDFSGFTERIKALKTRQYTYTRISRALLHILLDITKEQVDFYKKEEDYVSYARILGFRKDSASLLRAIKAHGTVPLITKTADSTGILPPHAQKQFNQDLSCSHIYQTLLYQKNGVRVPNEYTHPLIIL